MRIGGTALDEPMDGCKAVSAVIDGGVFMEGQAGVDGGETNALTGDRLNTDLVIKFKNRRSTG